MKLRLRNDSLRLRLNRSEVAGLIEAGALEETVSFGPPSMRRLVYAVRLLRGGLLPGASFRDDQILVELPAAAALAWAEGAEVGLYAETKWGLKIAVEKDFKCLTPRPNEDDTDAYDHPGGTAHHECDAGATHTEATLQP